MRNPRRNHDGVAKMTVCENCGWPVGDGTKHETDGEDICRVRDADSGRVLGWKRKRPSKNLYKK